MYLALFLPQILEPRFNGDTLAMLLNIPPQKTLLRRHLTTNFNVLIGPEAQQEKQEIMESTAYTPLTTTAKVRVGYVGILWISWPIIVVVFNSIRKSWKEGSCKKRVNG